MTTSPEWMTHAACRGATTVFFVEGRGGDTPGRLNAAKRICADCPVRDLCLRHAVAAGERFGVWGGMTTHERQRWARANPVRERDCVECGRTFTPPRRPGTPQTTCDERCASRRRTRQQDESRRRRAS